MELPEGAAEAASVDPHPQVAADSDPPPQGSGDAKKGENRPVSFQRIHVQLQGGAPWGFTLKGGLEHGEPLIVSKIEDGGKAAQCRMMQIGDELVNINGTPLYGSRQEALILIKGSYRILKMIVRRRNVPIIRPHSWHLAKLSEVRPETGTMHFPPDTFSLSWHSGCETSDLSMQWSQLSRHCSTDKSSSIGSMESLDQPSQSYYEGNLSPIDQNMYHNKRDSAYSSFSASSNASDYTVSLKTEESASMDCILQDLGPCKHNDDRYLQTGNGSSEAHEEASLHRPCGHSEPNSRPHSCTYEQSLSTPGKAPPQPPVRRDSLRAPRNHPIQEKRRASAPVDSLHVTGRWSSDSFLPARDKGVGGRHSGQTFSLCSDHMKDCLSADQYYMLSSLPDKCQKCTELQLAGKVNQNSDCSLNKIATNNHVPRKNVKDSEVTRSTRPTSVASNNCTNSCTKEHLTGQAAHCQGTPAQILLSDLEKPSDTTDSKSSEPKPTQEGHHWTVSPLHNSGHITSPCSKESSKEQLCQERTAREVWSKAALEVAHKSRVKTEDDENRYSSAFKAYPNLERSCSVPNGIADPQQDFQTSTQLTNENPVGLRPAHSTEGLVEEFKDQDEARLHVKKPGSSRFRSAQIRRRSERFATNLRNEIQRRKAQLHKSNGSTSFLCGEEAVEETEEPCESPPPPHLPLPPPPPPKIRLPRLEKVSDLLKTDSTGGLLEMPKEQEVRVTEIQRVTDYAVDSTAMSNAKRTAVYPKNNPPISDVKPSTDTWQVTSSECLNEEPLNHDPVFKKPARSNGYLHDRTSAVSDVKWRTPCPSPDFERKRDSQVSPGGGGQWTWCPEQRSQPKAKQTKGSQSETLAKENQLQRLPKQSQSERIPKESQLERRYKESQFEKLPEESHSERLLKENHSERVEEERHSKRLDKGNQSERLVKESQSEKLLKDRQSERLFRQSHSQRQSRESQPERQERESQHERLAKESQPETQESESQDERLFREIQPERQARESQIERPSKESQSERLSKESQSEKQARESQSERLFMDGQSERQTRESLQDTYDSEPEIAATAPKRITSDSVLLPFADRRKFFEETFRIVPPSHLPGVMLKTRKPILRPKHTEPSVFQPVIPDCRNVRRCSVDQSYPPSPARPEASAVYTDCGLSQAVDQPMCYNQVKHAGDHEYVRAFTHACSHHGAVVHDPCMYCSGDICPAFVKMNLQPSHHSFCCHHHQWPRCGECFCQSQHKVLEESSLTHSDPWSSRKSCFQELPPDEWEKPAPISRKTSKSVSELPYCKIGFQRTSPLRPRCDREHDWPMCFRSVSTQDLSCDCDRSIRVLDVSAYEDGLVDPPPLALRGRAFSESHISFEPPPVRVRERREPALGKLEETNPEPLCLAKKKGPPRPPPPNWGRFGTRRASHQNLYSTVDTPRTGTSPQSLQPQAVSQQQQRCSEITAARQRSQSLPLEKVHSGGLKAVAIQPTEMNCQFQQEYNNSVNTDHPSKHRIAHNFYYNMPESAEDPMLIGSGHNDTSRLAVRHFESNSDLERSTGSEAGDRSSLSSWTEELHKSQPVSPCPAPENIPGNVGEEEGCRPEIKHLPPPVRRTSEELMRDVADRDRSLAMVLNPASGLVTTAEVMSELFSKGDRQSWTEHFEKDWSVEKPGQERYEFQPISPPPPGGSISPTSYSAYYNTSAGKAELLNKMKELPEEPEDDSGEEMDAELAQKKLQLIESISKKLSVLQEAQRGLLEDIGANASLGEEVETLVRTVCKPNELDKYRLFIGDLDKVVNLLLSLSGRLARVENALNSLDPETAEEEKPALLEKKRQLTEQLEDAKELKEHVDCREKVVHDTVAKYLTADQLLDYHHFVKMKSALIIEQRELEEKIKLGEEQLKCLQESLPNPRDY